MVIVHEFDRHKYYDKQRRVDIIKYSNGVKTIVEGSAFYLPRRQYDGENLFYNIIKFVSDNKDTITNIAGVASSVADTVGKVGSTAIDIVKKAREIRIPAITDDAMNKLLNAKEVSGSGFYYI